jgi:hypothetical protein
MKRRALCLGAIAVVAMAGVAFAGKNYQSTRSNVHKPTGLAFAAPGISVSLTGCCRKDRPIDIMTNRTGEVVFPAVRVGDYTLAVTPVETRAGKVTGLEVWGGLVTCGEGAIREGKMTCTVKVTFDGKARSGDLTVALLTTAPDAPR